MTAQVRVVGLGMGPHQLTREAEAALRAADYVLAFRKGAEDALLGVRRAVCAEFGLELVEIEDPERDRLDPSDYPGAVRDWHDARAAAVARVLTARTGVAAFLVWGDPSLYDSTLRLLERVAASMALTWDVLPGIATPQLLAARHRIVLHRVGEPVHITTARRLRDDIAAGQRNLLVMLGALPELGAWSEVADWSIWWGANLGSAGEQLVCGTVSEVAHELPDAKERARVVDGWVMDAYLVRSPTTAPPDQENS